MIDGMSEYLDHIRAEYARLAESIHTDAALREECIADFNNELMFSVHTKYIKVISRKSVHSFVCRYDMGKFTKGDILKAASWAAPAKNFSRGNIMARNFGTISWAGA